MKTFPLRGVIGIVANAASELDLAASKGLQCVEVRGDLLLYGGLSLDEVIQIVERAQELKLACLFTLRHPTHGGKFNDTEQQRVLINRRALAAGADIIDLEWGTEAAAQLLSENVPLILSHHDFDGMIDERELATLTEVMSKAQPRAIKIVPTAATPSDAARILRWVADADVDIVRIGFAMGAAGACSRVLTMAFGAPITYASFGRPVAPGQVDIDDLLELFR
jgi:3-dehydroquinate dehydratase-1